MSGCDHQNYQIKIFSFSKTFLLSIEFLELKNDPKTKYVLDFFAHQGFQSFKGETASQRRTWHWSLYLR